MIPIQDKGEETPKQEIPFEFMQFPGEKGSSIHERTPEQEREEIKNWINQADPHPEQKEDEMLTWFVMAYGALEELCKLKKIKDELDFSSEGNHPEVFANDYADYKARKNTAWYAANQVIELWKKSDYGAKPIQSSLKEEIGLLPCPFCGKEPEWVNLKHPSGIPALKCFECQFEMQQDRRDKTIFFWNRRASFLTPKSIRDSDWHEKYLEEKSCKEDAIEYRKQKEKELILQVEANQLLVDLCKKYQEQLGISAPPNEKSASLKPNK